MIVHRFGVVCRFAITLITVILLHSGIAFSQDRLLIEHYNNGQQATNEYREYEHLLEMVRERGRIQVIVRLDVQFTAEGLLDPSEVVEQRGNIRSVQESLFSAMIDMNITAVKQYRYVPYIAMEIDEKSLLYLIESPYVIEIIEDRHEAPDVFDTIGIIGGTAAWSGGYTGDGYVVVILDTGVDLDHPFFEGRIVNEACFSTNSPAQDIESLCPNGEDEDFGEGAGDKCDLPISSCEHGTHVAGIAAGKGTDFSGVAHDADIITIQVFRQFNDPAVCAPADPPCVRTSASDQISAFEWIYDIRNDYNIVSFNMSFSGGQHFSPCDNDPRKPAIDNLRSVNIAAIGSSGNQAYTNALRAPACISTVISVGSTTKTDEVSSFSNSAHFLDLLAPGSLVYSAIPDGGFSTKSGTSMAAPHVSGAWAVVRQHNPEASVTDVLELLSGNGIPILDTRNNITKPRIYIGPAVGMSPDLALSPASFSESMDENEISTHTLTISNTGTAELEFNISWMDEAVMTSSAQSHHRTTSRNSGIIYQTDDRLPAEPADDINGTTDRKSELTVSGDIIPPTDRVRQRFDMYEILFDNGPLVNSPGTGPGGADESVLQNSSLGMSTLGFNISPGFRIADDFEVTDPEGWTIHGFAVYAYQTDSPLPPVSTIAAVNYRLWDGPPGEPGSNLLFGDITRNRLFDSEWADIFRVSETAKNQRRPVMKNTLAAGLHLMPGTYWLDWQVLGSIASGPWGPPVTIDGETTTGDALHYIPGDNEWNPRLDSGTLTPQGMPLLALGTIGEDWLNISAFTGTVLPGGSHELEITFNSTGLSDGFYFAEILVQSTDQYKPEVIVPVELTVGVPARVDGSGDVPDSYSLMQNYPNPFNPSTAIRYGLPERSSVKLEIYNTLGQRVATLVNAELEAGYHDVEWQSGNIASGMYFYRLEALSAENPSNRFIEVKSMVLLK